MAIEKIVVVDDEMMIRKVLRPVAKQRYSVASTGDLKGARKILSRDSFDLVLDLRLPDGDGTFTRGNNSEDRGSYGCNDDRLWFC